MTSASTVAEILVCTTQNHYQAGLPGYNILILFDQILFYSADILVSREKNYRNKAKHAHTHTDTHVAFISIMPTVILIITRNWKVIDNLKVKWQRLVCN